MCEFCTEHAEGKKWYLEMKNYSDELLHQELSLAQKEIVRANSRVEVIQRLFENVVIPAMPGVSKRGDDIETEAPQAQAPEVQPSEEEIVKARKIGHFGQVLPIEDVEEVIDMVHSITRMPCGCRFVSIGKTDKRYCFGLGVDRWGILGKFPDAASSLEVLEKDQAKKILRAYDEEGLIHTIWTGITPYVMGICNCDRDCMAYKRYIEKRGAPSFFRAEYICQIDWDLCTGCKSCMSQCQFGAQFYSSTLARVYINPARCFGCGVCRAACPNEAISILPRGEVPEAAGVWLRNMPK